MVVVDVDVVAEEVAVATVVAVVVEEEATVAAALTGEATDGKFFPHDPSHSYAWLPARRSTRL
jgi:hypothetical protein